MSRDPNLVNLQVHIARHFSDEIDALIGTAYGLSRAEVARYLLRVGYLHQQAALEAAVAKKQGQA